MPVTYANDLFERLFNPSPGTGTESLFYFPPAGNKPDMGMSLSECMIRAIHPTDGSELYNLIGNMFFGGQSNPCGISHIVRCRTARGESFMAMVRARFYLKEGGRFWAHGINFQPLPMSRFLFPLAKPLGPAEGTSAEASFASLSVFEEPTQPQTCKTCEVMTKEALAFHFRSLTDGSGSNKEPAREDLFVTDDGTKSEDDDDPIKKARMMIESRSNSSNMVVPPTYPASATMDPAQSSTYSEMEPPAPMFGKVRQLSEQMPQAMPSLNLTASEVEVLDAFLAVGEDGEEDREDATASWDNWADSQQVGEDFWQAISNPGFEVSTSVFGDVAGFPGE